MIYDKSFYDLYDGDDYQSFIKKVEKQFRTSPEYTIWLNSKVDRESCAATGFNKDSDGIDIEVHHYGITLWQWVENILDCFAKESRQIPVNSHYVCLILTDLHMNGCVPYIPLLHCLHKMLHARGENHLELKFPGTLAKSNPGNIILAQQLIEEHVINLKTKLFLEEKN